MFTNIPQIFSVGIIKSKSVSGSSKVCMIYRWRVLVFTVAITCYNSSYCQKNDILSPILIGSPSLMRVFVLVSFSAEFQDKRQIVQVRERGLQTRLNPSVRQIIYSLIVKRAVSSLRGFGSLLARDINSWLVLFLFWCCLYFRQLPPVLTPALSKLLLIRWNSLNHLKINFVDIINVYGQL